MKKLLCIDGNSILNRQFYGIRFLSTKDGFPTNAIFGFVNVITKQLDAIKPDFCAVAFDLKAPTFRHTLYSDYKAGRKPSPDDLIKQFPVAKEICRAMGISVLELAGYEADDILGTLSRMAGECSEETCAYILTGDRDSLQLISERSKVLLATNTDTVVIGSLMLLVPGVSIGIAMRDIFCGDLLSGMLKLLQACLAALMLAFGYILAATLMGGGAI